jgi:hypothetical protein
MKMKLITASIVFTLLEPFLFGGCGSKLGGEGFAIYLTRDNIPPDKIAMQSHVEIADKPLISINDIKSYTWDTHKIELVPEAFQKLKALKVPTTGISFAACVNKSPVYCGAFWTPVSSQSFDGVTIMMPSNYLEDNVISLQPGYPGLAFFSGKDPRSNPLIKEALEKAGKLK